jgi:hypothetical protein
MFIDPWNPRRLLIVPFVRREAVLSSLIEGTQAPLADLYAYQAVRPASSESPSDAGEALNRVWALEYSQACLREFSRQPCPTHAVVPGALGADSLPV